MSELINKNDNRATIRWKLLTGASALALTAYAGSTSLAKAEDTGRPTIWIELGGELEQMQGVYSPFIAPFMQLTPTPDPYKGSSPISLQRPPRYALGLDGKISFQPEDSDWVFSAGIRYGRSHSNRHKHQQTNFPTTVQTFCYYSFCYTLQNRFGDAQFVDVGAPYREQHAIVDFNVGRDVGLGLFGRGGTSNIAAGVRFMQFSSKSNVDIYARPSIDIVFPTLFGVLAVENFHEYTLHASAARSFKGVGPSLSWNASAVLAGNAQDGELTLDWGADVAVLFGRQKAKISHNQQGYDVYHTAPGIAFTNFHYIPDTPQSNQSTRSRSIAVPNVGGSLGLSVKYPNVQFSIGYRYDTFLKAMDMGIDARKTSNLTFNGPYASISIGIGD